MEFFVENTWRGKEKQMHLQGASRKALGAISLKLKMVRPRQSKAALVTPVAEEDFTHRMAEENKYVTINHTNRRQNR